MAVRRALLVGSLPGDTPTQAMELALDTLGPDLIALPGGEVGRPYWAASITEELSTQQPFQVAKAGEFTDYDDLTRLSVTGDIAAMDLGHYRRYLEEVGVARELMKTRGLALPFQVGMPAPFDQATISVGPRRGIKYYKQFEMATLRDVMQIYTDDETVLFQFEIPLELKGIVSAPRIVRSIATRKLMRKVIDFVRGCPPGLRIGIHFCVGRLQNKPLTTMTELAPLVDAINELCAHWPPEYTLVYVHLPLAAGSIPPPRDLAWYADLVRLEVPAGVRIVMGLCHEKVTTDQLMPILAGADTLTGRVVDVGASCGLVPGGTRILADVRRILIQQAELCSVSIQGFG